jgi:hypothetical protein
VTGVSPIGRASLTGACRGRRAGRYGDPRASTVRLDPFGAIRARLDPFGRAARSSIRARRRARRAAWRPFRDWPGPLVAGCVEAGGRASLSIVAPRPFASAAPGSLLPSPRSGRAAYEAWRVAVVSRVGRAPMAGARRRSSIRSAFASIRARGVTALAYDSRLTYRAGSLAVACRGLRPAFPGDPRRARLCGLTEMPSATMSRNSEAVSRLAPLLHRQESPWKH